MTDREERHATLDITFIEHKGHWKPSSASVSFRGVHIGSALDAMFNSMEEVIAWELLERSRLARELVEWQYDFDGDLVPLEERTKRLGLKLLAHQMMLSRVASRAYAVSSASTVLHLPRD